MRRCSAETRGQFEMQLKRIVRGEKTLATVLQEDGQKYKTALESATTQSHVCFCYLTTLLFVSQCKFCLKSMSHDAA